MILAAIAVFHSLRDFQFYSRSSIASLQQSISIALLRTFNSIVDLHRHTMEHVYRVLPRFQFYSRSSKMQKYDML